MARLNSVLLITSLVVLVCCSLPYSLDARKILKMETQMVHSLKGEVVNYPIPIHGGGSLRLVAHLTNNERVLASSNPSPGAGH
ncbi:putative transmembrane protein [Sesbania bispinosa]|nr:putative transmembrane protein [Sesbania bispinosa]